MASDLFGHKNSIYLLVVDYFPRSIEIQKLTTNTSSSVIPHLKAIFSQHGIPATLVTDNGPSEEMIHFHQPMDFNMVQVLPTITSQMGKLKEQSGP